MENQSQNIIAIGRKRFPEIKSSDRYVAGLALEALAFRREAEHAMTLKKIDLGDE